LDEPVYAESNANCYTYVHSDTDAHAYNDAYDNTRCYTNGYRYCNAYDRTQCYANSYSLNYSPANAHSQAKRNTEDATYAAATPLTCIYEKEMHCSASTSGRLHTNNFGVRSFESAGSIYMCCRLFVHCPDNFGTGFLSI